MSKGTNTNGPPSFKDLGKEARDLFTEGYHFGFWKFDCKTKTKSGVEFRTTAQSNPLNDKIYGAFSIKHLIENRDTLMEKCTTYESIIGKLETQSDNFKLAVEGISNFKLLDTKARLVMSYGNSDLKTDSELILSTLGSRLTASIVFAFGKFFAGYQTTINEQNPGLIPNNVALSYKLAEGDVLHATMHQRPGRMRTDYAVSFFKPYDVKLDLGVQMSWTHPSSYTKIGFGLRKHLSESAVFRAMIINGRQFGTGYQLSLFDGITIFFSALIDGRTTSCQVGIAAELEA